MLLAYLPKLMEYITGEAQELLEHIKIEEMCKETGYQLLLKALDEKYLERTQKAIQKYLQEYFYKNVIKQNETYRQYMVRLDSTYIHLKSHGVELFLEIRGWFLTRKL